MNVLEFFKRLAPALALMMVCSAVILYLPPMGAGQDGSTKGMVSGQEEKPAQADKADAEHA